MKQRHFVIALQDHVLVPDFVPIVIKGTIISMHTDSHKARDRAEKINARNSVTSSKPVVGYISTDEKLKACDVRPELAEQFLVEKYDSDAIYTMKCVLDPTWHGGQATSEKSIGYRLEDLKLSLDDLRIKYQDRAQTELDELGSNRIAAAERTARMKAVGETLTKERSQFTYQFPAVAGVQAGRAYYVAQVPYSALVKLLRFDEEDVVPAELRAQRVLNTKRGDAIGEYIVENPKDYVLPAITVSVSAEMNFASTFIPFAGNSLGMLHIPMEATMLINDGQHRRDGIAKALLKMSILGNETLAVTIFYDEGLRRSQQIFADINGKAVKPSSALNALYDLRNPYNAWVLNVMEKLGDIGRLIDVENASVPAKSYKLWSLIAFKKFLGLLTGVTEKSFDSIEPANLESINDFLEKFFAACAEHIPQWRQMIKRKISAAEVREHFVIGHAVWLEALGLFARYALFAGELLDNRAPTEGVISPESAQWDRLKGLASVDPHKDSPQWQNRCVVIGKMQKTSDGVKSTAAQLMKLATVELPSTLQEVEQRLAA